MERKRWLVLAVFTVIGLIIGMGWITYSASAKEARLLYGEAAADKGTINMLLNYGPITSLFGMPLAMWLVARDSRAVYPIMLFSTIIGAVGAMIRVAPSLWPSLAAGGNTMLWVHAGQCIMCFSGPGQAVVIPVLTASWFAPSERMLATSIAYSSQGECADKGSFLSAFGRGATAHILEYK